MTLRRREYFTLPLTPENFSSWYSLWDSYTVVSQHLQRGGAQNIRGSFKKFVDSRYYS